MNLFFLRYQNIGMRLYCTSNSLFPGIMPKKKNISSNTFFNIYSTILQRTGERAIGLYVIGKIIDLGLEITT